MKLVDMKIQEDNEEKLYDEIKNVRFKIMILNTEYENALYSYQLCLQGKIVEQKKYIKNYIEKYLIGHKFIIATDITIGDHLNLTAKYKNVIIELDNLSQKETFIIKCIKHDIHECFKIEQVITSSLKIDIELDKLLTQYQKNSMNINNVKDANSLIEYLEKNIKFYKQSVESMDKITFRFKHSDKEKYSNSIEDIIKELFEN